MRAALILFKADGRRKDLALRMGGNTIGRGAEADLRMPVESVSRIHATLTLEAGGLFVKDMNSANGTFVNGHRISEVELSPNDELTIGPVTFVVQINGEPSDPLPVVNPIGGHARGPRADDPFGALEDMSEGQNFEDDLGRL